VQSLSRQVHGRGGDAGSKLLAFETIDAPAKVAKHLNLRINSHVLYIQRLRTASGLPFCVESSYLPAESFGALSQNELTDSGSLYEILNRRFGVLPAGSKDKLKIAWPTAEEAQWLCITTDQPVLYFRSIVFDASGKPFEFVKSINHPTRVAFFSASVIPNQT
jgi:GntR family transcriptional regulator